jgi:glutamyl-tRNA synthetase
MDWLGLDYDEGPIYQTHRLDRYREVAEAMVAAGTAYYAYETKEEIKAAQEAALAAKQKPRYGGYYRDRGEDRPDDPNRVIRFKNPIGGSVVWDDLVKGRIEISNDELDDLVIFRSDGYATYNFAVVVDDIDMGITDVVRGDDHVNNTPRQINIYRALGATVPNFAHLPMILDEDGAKLSKRTGAADVMQYRDAGYLPHALLNYLVRLGWSHGDQEIFSIDDMVKLFELKDVNPKASRLDMAKLGWLNQQYLKSDDPAAVAPHLEWHLRSAGHDLSKGPAPADVVVALRDRVQTLKDMAERAAVWFQPLTTYDEAAVAKHLKPEAAASLSDARDRLATLPAWTVETVSAALHATAEALGLGMGKVAQPMRVAITGTQVSPDISHTVYLAGQGEAVARIDAALEKIAGQPRPAA